MAAQESSASPPRGRVSSGQGEDARRAAGGWEAEQRGTEALPETRTGGLNDDRNAASAECEADGALQQQSAEPLATHMRLLVSAEEVGADGEDVRREQGKQELGLVGSEGVDCGVGFFENTTLVMGLRTGSRGEGGSDRALEGTEVALGSSALVIASEEGLGTLFLDRGAGQKEEVFEEEVLLFVRVFEDDKHHAAGALPLAGPIGEFVEPGVATGRGPSRRPLEEGSGEPLQDGMGADAADVADLFRFERAQEGRCGETGIGAEPDAGNEGSEPVQDGQHKLDAPRCGMGVAGAELAAEEVAALDAGDHGMEAASTGSARCTLCPAGGRGLRAGRSRDPA